jgi:tellurite resistance protein
MWMKIRIIYRLLKKKWKENLKTKKINTMMLIAKLKERMRKANKAI